MINYQNAKIASGTALTSTIRLNGAKLVGIIMPAAWTAANLTLQGATASDGTFSNVYDDAGNELTITAAASQAIGITEAKQKTINFPFIKIRSGTGAIPVNQAADRTLTLIFEG